ncbi:hypothetical protein QEN19_001163 [Hanseniaspora menglaensis]
MIISLSKPLRPQKSLQALNIINKSTYHYQPMIKFVYNNESPLEIIDRSVEETHIHPCSGSVNLFPTSEECMSVSDWQSKFFKPFLVQKYSAPAVSKKNSKTLDSYTNSTSFLRPLKDKELDSLSSLPKNLKFKDLDENEIEFINGGGVMI